MDDPVCRTGVRISKDVEVENAEFRSDESRDPCLPGRSRNISSHGESKKRRKINTLLLTKKKFSLADSPLVSPRKRVSLEEDPSFVAALDKSFEGAGARKSSRDSRAAPVS